jgi:hypothetical protein
LRLRASGGPEVRGPGEAGGAGGEAMIAFLIIGVGLGWFASWVLVAGAYAAGWVLGSLIWRKHT